MAVQPEDVRLLANHGFRRLTEARTLHQVAQNAMLYTLLILVVNETGSSIQSTILVTAWMLPSIVFGIPAGGLADVLPRRPLLVIGYGIRAALVLGMLINTENVWTIYALVLAYSSIGQFTSPAESAALPALVGRSQLPGANSWLLLSVMVGQAVGAVALAPVLLKMFGVETSLGASAAIFVASTFLVATVTAPMRDREAEAAARSHHDRSGIVDAITAGWTVLRTSRQAFLALVYLTVVATLGKALAILAPPYAKDVLSIQTENAVYVVAPAAIGALLGLVLTPLLARVFGPIRVAAFGFVLYVIGIAGLGLVVLVRDAIVDNWTFGFSFVEEAVGEPTLPLVSVAMILAVPIGFAATVVGVAGKAVLNQEAPQGKQGRVFATQATLSDALSLLPLFAIGGVAELVGVREVLLVAAVIALLVGVYLTFSTRIGPRQAHMTPAADAPTSS